jgi:MFS family permease
MPDAAPRHVCARPVRFADPAAASAAPDLREPLAAPGPPGPPAVSAVSVSARATSRPVLSRRLAYALAASIIGLCLFASTVPSALYGEYAARWHFAAVTLTLIFGTYAFGVLAALLLAGRLSDQVGRRPVLLVALSGLIVSALLFLAAAGTTWLFVARAVQGVSTGLALSAASAALLDLHARRDPVSAGLVNGVASTTGLGLGGLVSAMIVQAGAAPRVLPYVLLLVLFAGTLAGVFLMPDSASGRAPFRLTPQRPSVPAGIRHPFLLAGLAVLASWSIGGLFFSLGPALSAHLFNTGNVIAAAFGGAALGLCAALAQLVFRRSPPWFGTSVGSLALAAGTLLIVVATAADSAAVFVVGAVVAGAGFGVAYLGGLRQLVQVIPPEHRAGVMSAFYVVAYASLSVPAVIAGVVADHLGLETTFETFGAIAAGLALIVAAEAVRTRPRS